MRPGKSALILAAAGALAGGSLRATEEPALKDLFAGKFLIGAALNHRIVGDPTHPARALVARHFNSITSANAMKWEPYEPSPGALNHEPVDAFLELAESNHQYVVGHTLFWHQQTPAWVFRDAAGAPITRETLIERMRTRVRELAKRYGDRVNAWDVVNEAFLDDGALRDSAWTKVLGADFVPIAFHIAQEELPAKAVLLYNDYNMNAAGRRASVVKLIHELRAQKLRIDAVGMQGHWRLETPAISEIEASIVAFGAAGVRVLITELDIEMLPRAEGMSGADLDERRRYSQDPANNPYKSGLPDEMQQRLARRYADIFALFLKHADIIDRVTFWGVTDADSWLNNWPVPGRTNYPLLFDRTGKPKPAFDAVVKVARGS